MKFLSWCLGMLVSGFLGSYLAGYLSKKGENLATHEDLDKLVEQMKATTSATKSIEAQISDKVWDRQRHWEMKRDAIVGALLAMERVSRAFREVAITTTLGNQYVDERDEKLDEYDSAFKAFEENRTVVGLVCGKEMRKSLSAYARFVQEGVLKLGHGIFSNSEKACEGLGEAIALVKGCARREVGSQD